MSAIDELLEHHAQQAATDTGAELAPQPRRRVAIVTCMDARIDLPAALAIRPGDVHVLRNAGGIVTEDMIRSLAISQEKLGTREVMVIHHTKCGMEFPDLDASVREDVARLQETPSLPHRDHIRGFVYDVDTHRLREVERA